MDCATSWVSGQIFELWGQPYLNAIAWRKFNYSFFNWVEDVAMETGTSDSLPDILA